MDIYLLISEFILIVYYILEIINNFNFGILSVGFILVYIIITMGQSIFHKKSIYLILTLIKFMLIYFGYFYVDNKTVIFLPLNLYTNIKINSYPHIKVFIALIILLVLPNDLIQIYTFITLIMYLIYYVLNHFTNSIEQLVKDIITLKNKNETLKNKIYRQEEFESQLKYTFTLEERNNISQKIHDELGHTLSGTVFQLEAANLLLDKDIKKAKALIGNTIDKLRDGMDNIRNTLKEIKPEKEQIGISKIMLLIEEIRRSSDVEVILFHDNYIDKASFIHWKIIYDNITESITNSLKHSRANKITINISVINNKLIKLEIKDNGIGVKKINKGMGIRGMEERCESIGGKLIVDGSDGFSVISLLPIDI
ncbi:MULTISPECIES: sensor histidine kinase [unclassified Clostridium]|uniref:sensor histidine kinase n=1 Tax=unclassified Clostridium TaxID=2614128 RepID=UPI000ED63205|nr:MULTISPECIES: histidine kinase [unclassified Clostridium]HCQ91732.1 hypothetical protein [Clostridium sp.]